MNRFKNYEAGRLTGNPDARPKTSQTSDSDTEGENNLEDIDSQEKIDGKDDESQENMNLEQGMLQQTPALGACPNTFTCSRHLPADLGTSRPLSRMQHYKRMSSTQSSSLHRRFHNGQGRNPHLHSENINRHGRSTTRRARINQNPLPHPRSTKGTKHPFSNAQESLGGH